MARYLFVIPTLTEHDAAGRDLLLQSKALRRSGAQVDIYAEFPSAELRSQCLDRDTAWTLLRDENTTVVYHYCVFWHLLPDLLKTLRGKFVLRFHNVTPPHFYKFYDFISYYATRVGVEQLLWVLANYPPHLILSASAFNLSEISHLHAGLPTAVVAPMTDVTKLGAAASDPAVESWISQHGEPVLFVGRTVPNKGHYHLVATMAAYRQIFGESPPLMLVGSLSPNLTGYKSSICSLASKSGAEVHFEHSANQTALATWYRRSSVFLCMSEHEGFCVPVIEAQLFKLPVLALDRAAVGQTAGPHQMTFKDLDYDLFANALYKIIHDSTLRAKLVEQGLKNAAQYDNAALASQLTKILAGGVR
jgi:glycosyltransferase involved in cell wall biosynthesis